MKQMKERKAKNDEGVSPVIGVILMVAITVILAAVIAAFVFGMASDMKPPKIVSFTTERYGVDSITVVNAGGNDANDLASIEVKIEDGDFVQWVGSKTVGSSQTYVASDGVTASYTHVVVRGTFSDGDVQILLDTHV